MLYYILLLYVLRIVNFEVFIVRDGHAAIRATDLRFAVELCAFISIPMYEYLYSIECICAISMHTLHISV